MRIRELEIFGIDFEGIHLVEAGAGTGKTYNITSMYLRALVELKLLPSQILVLTFTNDATHELKRRLRARVKQVVEAKEGGIMDDPFVKKMASKLNEEGLVHLKKCMFSFDEANISTIHGFCQRVLMEYSIQLEVPTDFEIISDENELIQEATDRFWNHFFFDTPINSEFEKWYKSHLEVLFRSPDKLLSEIKELIKQPDTKLFPRDRKIEDFQSSYDENVRAFHHLKEVFKSDIESLKFIFESDALHGGKYKNKEKLLTEIESWLEAGNTSLMPFNDLNKFGNFMPEKGLKKNKTIPHLNLFDAIDNYLKSFEELRSIEIAFRVQSVEKIRLLVDEIKHTRGRLGYNDLLLLTRNGLKENPAIAQDLSRRYPISFIDEFQDTDHIQYSIFSSIYNHRPNTFLLLIGDPKQAIYRFRGADLNTYFLARNDVNPENTYSLTHNYRSGSKLIYGINALFMGVESPFKIDELNFLPAKFPSDKPDFKLTKQDQDVAPVNILEFDSEGKKMDDIRLEIANSVATEIVELLSNVTTINETKVTQDQIAILVDTHRNATLIKDVLWQYGLRSIINNKVSVFQTNEAEELLRVLVAISNPSNTGLLRSALLTSIIGYSLQELSVISDDELRLILGKVSELKNTWESIGLGAAILLLESEFQVLINLTKTEDPERSITNYKHLIELLLNAERKNSLTEHAVIRYIRRKREQENISGSEDEIVRLESDEKLIQIVTHHASKGLQYRVVFCPFLWALSIQKPKVLTLSDGKSIRAYIDKNSDFYATDYETFISEEESEKMRLAYVALTRAEAMCFLYSNASFKKSSTKFDAINYLINNNYELKKIIKENPEVIQKRTLYVNDQNFVDDRVVSNQEIKLASFSRNDLPEFERIASFSSLTSSTNYDSDEVGYDYDFDSRSNESEQNASIDFSIFGLPKGKNTGNLLHAVFENIDFSDEATFKPVVNELIEELGYDPNWAPVILDLVKRTVSHHLLDGISLSRIKPEDRLVEMEFYFPIKKLQVDLIFKVLGKIKRIDKTDISGFMKGFIDLIFRCNGKYYILDYKSNHLGDDYSFYSNNDLKEEMSHADYDVQYHIYLVAFVRYMRTINPEFDYKKDFGGVIYLFLRGINSNVEKSGIFWDKPDLELINKLDGLMSDRIKNV